MSYNQAAHQENLAVVQSLEPSLLWQWFARICAIAHPSDYEEALAQDIVAWAKSVNLPVCRDQVGNVIITKPATEGMQDRAKIALQAHLDMVPQANADTVHDFTIDPIRLRFNPQDEAWLMATGTTLGADNGIGMASCLAVLQSQDIAHPEIEVLLTMTEETGMEGVFGLQPNELSAEIMINTDTEEIGEVYIGCAGGINADVVLPIERVPSQFDTAFTLELKGLRGGHSGIDIHKNRGNAIKILARILAKLQQSELPFALIDVKGGTLRNAIPRESFAVLACHQADFDKISTLLNENIAQIRQEISIAEPKFVATIATADLPSEHLSVQNSQTIVHLLNALPSGVVRNSDTVADTVETSLSFGKVSIVDGKLKAVLLVRSLIETGKEAICGVIDSTAKLAGATATFDGDYVGWNPDSQSKITPLTVELYTKILGKQPEVKVIHAGLECGLIKKSHPNMDIVSIGPTIKNAHSPDEMVHIQSVATYWQLLTDILANAPKAKN